MAARLPVVRDRLADGRERLDHVLLADVARLLDLGKAEEQIAQQAALVGLLL